MRVNLEVLKQAQQIQRKTGGWFCQDCGDTEPKSDFYPMSISSGTSPSCLLCNDCEQKRRGRFNA